MDIKINCYQHSDSEKNGEAYNGDGKQKELDLQARRVLTHTGRQITCVKRKGPTGDDQPPLNPSGGSAWESNITYC